MGNMYSDSVKQWNVIIGCQFSCIYCKKSFQAQMKRQKHNCIKCYNYEPHFHPERLKQSLPNTYGDEFIWCCSSSDISFAKKEWIEQILDRIRELPHKTFFMQTKDPKCLFQYNFPDNMFLGITLETNRISPDISKAPDQSERYHYFKLLNFPRKVVTIEPILQFDMEVLPFWIENLLVDRVYIGYDTKKNNLLEPKLAKTLNLIKKLKKFTKVKTKLIRDAWDES